MRLRNGKLILALLLLLFVIPAFASRQVSHAFIKQTSLFVGGKGFCSMEPL